MATRTAVVNVRMEPLLKQQASDVFSESGLSFSDAVNAFCKEAVRRGTIPFRFTARKRDPLDVSEWSREELLAALQKAERSKSVPYETAKVQFEQEMGISA